MPFIPRKNGLPVSSRQFSWADMVHRAWGSEFYAPDHGIYDFAGRLFDSTDKYLTGIYGVAGDNPLLLDGTQYPDMRDALEVRTGFDQPGQVMPAGSHDELSVEYNSPVNTNLDPARQYPA